MDAFKKWILETLVEYLVKNLTPDTLAKWAEMLKTVLIPYLRGAKVKLIENLREQAAKSDTQIDDVAVDALDKFLDALLPDNTSTL